MADESLKEELDIQHRAYFRDGLDLMFDHENCGFLPAFASQSTNELGFPFTLDSFNEFLADYEVDISQLKLPSEFIVRVRFSPIALFKYWIFNISNTDNMKISDRAKGYSKDFFFLLIDDLPHFVPITSNIAHERFLMGLYFRDAEGVQQGGFSTNLISGRKLVLYKDYRKRKVSVVDFKKSFDGKRKYSFRVNFAKTEARIRFSVLMENKYKVNHAIRIADAVEGKTPKKSRMKSNTVDILEDCTEQVVDLLKKCQNTELKTNKHANVSLGRVNKIPVLLNLPKKFADFDITANYDESSKILSIVDTKKEPIKKFKISSSPKSNWLETA